MPRSAQVTGLQASAPEDASSPASGSVPESGRSETALPPEQAAAATAKPNSSARLLVIAGMILRDPRKDASSERRSSEAASHSYARATRAARAICSRDADFTLVDRGALRM